MKAQDYRKKEVEMAPTRDISEESMEVTVRLGNLGREYSSP